MIYSIYNLSLTSDPHHLVLYKEPRSCSKRINSTSIIYSFSLHFLHLPRFWILHRAAHSCLQSVAFVSDWNPALEITGSPMPVVHVVGCAPSPSLFPSCSLRAGRTSPLLSCSALHLSGPLSCTFSGSAPRCGGGGRGGGKVQRCTFVSKSVPDAHVPTPCTLTSFPLQAGSPGLCQHAGWGGAPRPPRTRCPAAAHSGVGGPPEKRPAAADGERSAGRQTVCSPACV